MNVSRVWNMDEKVCESEILAHFNRVLGNERVEVVRIGDSKGKGVLARSDFEEGDTVHTEVKFVGIKHLMQDDPCRSCDQCMRFIGPLEGHFVRMANVDLNPLPFKKPELKHLETEILACRKKCGSVFCSEQCEQIAWDEWHQLLCPAVHDRMTELIKFCSHTNETLFLAAKLICHIILDLDRAEQTSSLLVKATKRGTWWEIVQPPPDLTSEKDISEFRQSMKELCTLAFHYFTDGLPAQVLSRDELRQYLSLDFFSQTMGMFEMNNWSMVTKNPLYDHVASLTEDERLQMIQTVGEDSWSDICEATDVNIDGAGFYLTGSCFNHSCEPNVALLKNDDHWDDTTSVIALRSIVSGEELCISYIDESDDFEARQQSLADYQFSCACPKCTRRE